MKTTSLCPKCKTSLPPDAPAKLCPHCLIQEGLVSTGGPSAANRNLPAIGEMFGGYRILRELGRGGMGAVFEAEQLESGRRVALKVLSHQLDSPDARARFLREGRLAASINHPNSVYVFGTEEIEGTPVIAMELVAGGTLQQRVERQGPLPVSGAVDAILHVIAGLEAAQAIGILHRDIKPGNCFEDADGTVKIGDFGLSISTTGRKEADLTQAGVFLGTPAFSSPEQIRGEELSLRSDIYAVGVTLFYLLTGRPPFEGNNTVQLLANVLEQPSPSPRKLRPEVSPGLARVVLRCLDKTASERFKNYEELRQAIAPFSSTAPTPATLGRRFLAGLIDNGAMQLLGGGLGIGAMMLFNLSPVSFMDPAAFRSPKMLAVFAGMLLIHLLYYGLLEGRWGRALGKILCGLRVTGPDRNPPGVGRGLVRALLFVLLPILPAWTIMGFNPAALDPGNTWRSLGIGFSNFLVLGLLFCTMRRRNGFAAVHDLLTRTRVVRESTCPSRAVLPANGEAMPAAENQPRVGPYHILEGLSRTTAGLPAPGDGVAQLSEEWWLGYDTRLLRKVWIRLSPPGTPPVPPALRNLGRASRLRWLAGRRSPEENWDAFEGVTGKPLALLIRQRQPWSQVRFWLLDLANELAAAQKDGTQPAVLALDRVWITADGRAKLLDFPAPGTEGASGDAAVSAASAPPPLCEANRFLGQVAHAALAGPVPIAQSIGDVPGAPLPLHARSFLEKLPALTGVEAIVTALKPLLQHSAVVSKGRRLGVVAGCLALPLLGMIASMVGMRINHHWQVQQPEITELSQVLNKRMVMRLRWVKNKPQPDDRAYAIYIASHYRRTITNTAQWQNYYARMTIAGDNRRFAEQSVAAHPKASENEVQEATTALKPYLPNPEETAEIARLSERAWFPLFLFGVCLLFYVCLPALLAALLFRGGLVLRLAGVAFVRRDGIPASRLRVFWRGLIAWSPVWLTPVVLVMLMSPTGAKGAPKRKANAALVAVIKTNAPRAAASAVPVLTNSIGTQTNTATVRPQAAYSPMPEIPAKKRGLALLWGLLVIGLATWSLLLPERGLQDRLAGTWPVPR